MKNSSPNKNKGLLYFLIGLLFSLGAGYRVVNYFLVENPVTSTGKWGFEVVGEAVLIMSSAVLIFGLVLMNAGLTYLKSN
jgi:hypothetical protein